MKTTPQFQVDNMKCTMFAIQGHWERIKVNGRRLYGMQARVKNQESPDDCLFKHSKWRVHYDIFTQHEMSLAINRHYKPCKTQDKLPVRRQRGRVVRELGPVSRKSRNSSGASRVTILFVCSKRRCLARGTNLCSYFNFYSLFFKWKDQLYRLSGSESYEWLFGPERFSGLFEKRAPRLEIWWSRGQVPP